MKLLTKLNKDLFLSIKSSEVHNLQNILGGETTTTRGSTTTTGADGKVKTCDWTDKRNYTVSKDGKVNYEGDPYGFEIIECCFPITGNTYEIESDIIRVLESYE